MFQNWVKWLFKKNIYFKISLYELLIKPVNYGVKPFTLK